MVFLGIWGLLFDLLVLVLLAISVLAISAGYWPIALISWLIGLIAGWRYIGRWSLAASRAVDRWENRRSREAFDEQPRRHGKWGGPTRFKFVSSLIVAAILWLLLGYVAWRAVTDLVTSKGFIAQVPIILLFALYSLVWLVVIFRPLIDRVYPQWAGDRPTNRDLSKPVPERESTFPNQQV